MSALGQKQTFALQNGMSALPPKADMCGAKGDVRFVPIAGNHELQLKRVAGSGSLILKLASAMAIDAGAVAHCHAWTHCVMGDKCSAVRRDRSATRRSRL